MKRKPLGRLFIDVATSRLRPIDRAHLQHPGVGGVVLFARNVCMPNQVRALTAAIHRLRTPALSIAIDHEGGRVQRLREGFTRLPAQEVFGELYQKKPTVAERIVREMAWLVAVELCSVGIDTLLGPTVDLLSYRDGAVGDRAFHPDPEVVSGLSIAYLAGAQEGGIRVVPKHFPGHGTSVADPHYLGAVDSRSYIDLVNRDLTIFQTLVNLNAPAMMVGHVIYPAFDDQPASASRKWLYEVVRKRMKFSGLIFSDDVSMLGASPNQDRLARVQACLTAGCDYVLLCQGAFECLLEDLDGRSLDLMVATGSPDVSENFGGNMTRAKRLMESTRYASIRQELAKLVTSNQ